MKQVIRKALVVVVAVGFMAGVARLGFAGLGLLGEQLAWGSIVTDQSPPQPVVSEAARKPRTPEHRAELVMRAALQEDVHPALLRAIMHVESKGKPHAISKKGARGLMQVMPLNLKLCGYKHVRELHDEEKGLRCGARVFRRFSSHYKDRKKQALWGYNGGYKAVEVIERCGEKNRACLGGYAVTVDYARAVLARYELERRG